MKRVRLWEALKWLDSFSNGIKRNFSWWGRRCWSLFLHLGKIDGGFRMKKQEEPREETLECWCFSSTKAREKEDKDEGFTLYTKWGWVPQLAKLVELKASSFRSQMSSTKKEEMFIKNLVSKKYTFQGFQRCQELCPDFV